MYITKRQILAKSFYSQKAKQCTRQFFQLQRIELSRGLGLKMFACRSKFHFVNVNNIQIVYSFYACCNRFVNEEHDTLKIIFPSWFQIL